MDYQTANVIYKRIDLAADAFMVTLKEFTHFQALLDKHEVEIDPEVKQVKTALIKIQDTILEMVMDWETEKDRLLDES